MCVYIYIYIHVYEVCSKVLKFCFLKINNLHMHFIYTYIYV